MKKGFTLAEIQKKFPNPFAGNEMDRGLEEWRSSYLHVIDKNCEGQSAPTLTLPYGGGKNCLMSGANLAIRVRANAKGFTLAEVLITLGIIGVVTALTMPTLIKNYQKHETVNRLKETYSILYQAVRMSETENGLLETWEIPNSNGFNANTYTYGKAFFEQYLKPYLKVAKECKYLSNECWANEYIRPNGVAANSYFPASKNYTYGMVLANGSVIGFYPRYGFG